MTSVLARFKSLRYTSFLTRFINKFQKYFMTSKYLESGLTRGGTEGACCTRARGKGVRFS